MRLNSYSVHFWSFYISSLAKTSKKLAKKCRNEKGQEKDICFTLLLKVHEGTLWLADGSHLLKRTEVSHCRKKVSKLKETKQKVSHILFQENVELASEKHSQNIINSHNVIKHKSTSKHCFVVFATCH